MRNLHAYIKQKYGWESIFLLQQWEKLEKKMANFRNHRQFTIKCLKNNIVPVSVRLKTNIKTTKGLDIIRRAEKQLLNECIRSINNQAEMFMLKRDTCTIKLKELLDSNTMQECEDLIKRVIESRHNLVLARQKAKYEALQQQKIGGGSNKGYCTERNAINTCIDKLKPTSDSNSNSNGNIGNTNSNSNGNIGNIKKWVINLSNTPLTENQEKLLARGPQFVIKPKQPPVEEYITAIEKMCTKLEKGEADELRLEVKKALKKSQNKTRSFNITKEENKALQELRKDKEESS